MKLLQKKWIKLIPQKTRTVEIIDSKFGKFFTWEKKVFIYRKHGPLKYWTLIENDSKFFKEKIKTIKKAKFSSPKWSFIPTKHDWDVLKKSVFFFPLMITDKCNSNCKICWIGEEKCDEMSIDDLKDILSKIGKKKEVLLFGKEPTMHKNLFRMIEIIKKSDNFPELYTNGLKLANSNYVKELKRRGLKKIFFSLDGFKEDIYEKLRGDKNQLYIKLKALYNIKKYEIDTILGFTVVDGINEDQIHLILKFAIKNDFIVGIYFLPVTPYGRFDIIIKNYLTDSDIIKMLEKATFGEIRMKYFLEFKKLKKNINDYLNKIGLYFPINSLNAPFKKENGQIKEFIPLSELKLINRAMENHNFFLLLKYFLKYGFLKGLNPLNPLKSYYDTFKKSILWIRPGNVNTPLNHIPQMMDTIMIGMINEQAIFLAGF